MLHPGTLAALGAACVISARAADVVIVSLPWTSPLSAGPRAQNYPPDQDSRDIWIVEDFTTDQDWLIGKFSSRGNTSPTTDVCATILDDWPTTGQVVMHSVLGTGRTEPYPGSTWGQYACDFGHQRLPAGRYYIMWQADGNPSTLLPVFFAQGGAYAVGAGTPDNAYQYNPGGGWNLPDGVLDPVTSELNNQGVPIGVNFTLMGEVAPPLCIGDFNTDGGVDGADVESFFIAWEAADNRADVNRDGGVDGSDVETFFLAWEAGC